MLAESARVLKTLIRLLLAGLCAATLGCAAPAPKTPGVVHVETAADTPAPLDLDAGLAQLSEWFAGEWDNYEQVYQAKQAPSAANAHEHIHALFRAVEVPAIGGAVFFARQTLDDQPDRVFRLRLYRYAIDRQRDAIRLDQYSFVQEAPWKSPTADLALLRQLRPEDLRYVPECAVYFRRDPASGGFLGTTDPGQCKVASERLAKAVTVEDRIELGADRLWILSTARDDSGRLIYGNAAGMPHKLRKVHYYSGWIALNTAGRGARPEDKQWRSLRNVRLHSEGRVVPITWEDGRRTGYSVQLARLTFQGDKVHVLTLNLLDDATGQPVSYAWADPDARHIGLNLKWFQSGFALVDGDSRYESP